MEITIDMKYTNAILTGLFFYFFLNLGCNPAKKTMIITEGDKNNLEINQKKWLKDYAFCMCIYKGYNKDSLVGKDISLAILTDISDYSQETYNKLDLISYSFADSIKPSQIADYNKKRPVILKCLEFYNSKALDSLVTGFKKE